MKIDRKGGNSSSGSSGGPITAKSYPERAVAHMRSSGRSNGEHPVIRAEAGEDGKPATPEQWRAWMGYFAVLGYSTVYARKLGVMTVPTEWPWDFDAAASTEVPPAPYARPKRPLGDWDWNPETAGRFAELRSVVRLSPRGMPSIPAGGPYSYTVAGIQNISTGQVYPWRAERRHKEIDPPGAMNQLQAEARLVSTDRSIPDLSPELLAKFGIRPQPKRDDEPSEDAA